MIPISTKDSSVVIGYFSCLADGGIISKGNTRLIWGSEELMKTQLTKIKKHTANPQEMFIKKIRFGKILEHLIKGQEYALDKESFDRFIHFVKKNEIAGFVEKDYFSESPSEGDYQLVKIKMPKLRGS